MADNMKIIEDWDNRPEVAADDIGGVKFLRMKPIIGNDGVNDGDVSKSNPIPVIPGMPGLPFQFFLTENGDGTGTINLNGNYSGAATDFYYEATSDYDIYSVLVNVSDNANFIQTDYGGISLGLTNGIKFFVRLEDDVTYLPILSTNILAVKQNYQWLSLTPDIALTTFSGIAQTLTINFDVMRQYGMPLPLGVGQRFIVRLEDNFSGLVSQTFGLRGILH